MLKLLPYLRQHALKFVVAERLCIDPVVDILSLSHLTDSGRQLALLFFSISLRTERVREIFTPFMLHFLSLDDLASHDGTATLPEQLLCAFLLL